MKIKDLIDQLLKLDTNADIEFSLEVFGGHRPLEIKEIKEDIEPSPVADGLIYFRFR